MPSLSAHQRYILRLTSFVFLSSTRIMTLVALLLGIAGTILGLVQDFKARRADAKDGAVLLALGSDYWPGSEIPTATGGATAFGASHALSILILLAGVVSEIPLPASINARVQAFWAQTFPSFGNDRGVGILGLLMALLGSFDLGRATNGFPRGASWALFVVGLLNILVGLALRSDICFYRSLDFLTDPEEEVNKEDDTYRTRLHSLPPPVSTPTVSEPPRVKFRMPSFIARPFTGTGAVRPFSSAVTQRSLSVYSQDPGPVTPSTPGTPGMNTSSIRGSPAVRFGWEKREKLGPMEQVRRSQILGDER